VQQEPARVQQQPGLDDEYQARQRGNSTPPARVEPRPVAPAAPARPAQPAAPARR
jgi:hypothetical protein